MTIDEAIKRSEEVMVENMEKTKGRNASDPIAIYCFECAEEYRQLAEWLKDYKRLLEQEPVLDKIRAEIEANAYPIVHGVNNHEKGMTLYGILQIIDKYRYEVNHETDN